MRHIAASLLCTAVIACHPDGGSSGADGAAVRDSAGVRIVTNREPAWDPASQWRVTPDPVLRIGALQGEDPYIFTQARNVEVTRLSSGEIIVLDGGAFELRAFSPDGRHLWTAGGEGGGPAEFPGRPQDLHRLPGDTLQVNARRGLRRVRFTRAGEAVENAAAPWARAQAVLGEARRACLFPVPVFIGEMMVVGTACDTGTRPGLHTASASLTRISWSGEEVTDIGRIEIGQEWGYQAVNSRYYFNSIATPGPLPAYFAAVDPRESRYVAFNSYRQYRIEVYDVVAGRLSMVIGRADGLSPPTGQELDHWLASYDFAVSARRFGLEHEGIPTRPFDEDHERARAAVPDSISLAARMIYDHESNLWVMHRHAEDAVMAEWAVYRPDGVLLGHVQIPTELSVHDIGDDYIIGVTTDEHDVPYVTMYGLQRG